MISSLGRSFLALGSFSQEITAYQGDSLSSSPAVMDFLSP